MPNNQEAFQPHELSYYERHIKPKYRNAHIYLPHTLYDHLKQLADKDNTSVNRLILEALTDKYGFKELLPKPKSQEFRKRYTGSTEYGKHQTYEQILANTEVDNGLTADDNRTD